MLKIFFEKMLQKNLTFSQISILIKKYLHSKIHYVIIAFVGE